jgi:hypothetical protein
MGGRIFAAFLFSSFVFVPVGSAETTLESVQADENHTDGRTVEEGSGLPPFKLKPLEKGQAVFLRSGTYKPLEVYSRKLKPDAKEFTIGTDVWLPFGIRIFVPVDTIPKADERFLVEGLIVTTPNRAAPGPIAADPEFSKTGYPPGGF